MRTRSWLLIGLLGLMAAGCSSNELILKKQAEMDARMEQLIQANSASGTQLSDLATKVKELQEQSEENKRDLEKLKQQAAREPVPTPVATGQQAEVKPVQPAGSKIVVVGKGGAAGEKESAEQSDYVKAFGLFSSNDYPGAISAFEAFIKAHPTSEFAGNAQYWIGECYYTQREFRKSLEAFNKVVETYPHGNKVPDALLKVGFSLISLKEHQKARSVLEGLVEKYPKSPAAAKARERLSR